MRFCSEHWNRLRAAIDARGLGALVPDDAEKAAESMQRELADGPSIDSFDPLMGAHNAILGNVMNVLPSVGVNPMFLFAGDHCPLCLLIEKHGEVCQRPDCPDYETWIDRAADDALDEWKRLTA